VFANGTDYPVALRGKMRTAVYDKVEQIAHDAQIAAVIIGNPVTREFELIDPKAECAIERVRFLSSRGMFFCGILGLVDGVSRTALSEPLENATLDALAQAFLTHIERHLEAQLREGLEQKALDGWLARLCTDIGHA
jgi:hypothetical protein